MNCINGGNDQLPKRSEEKKFFGNDSEHCNTSARSSSSDPPLSEYELFRLQNIKRNEARLIQLGLLVPDAIPAKRDKKQSSIGSASTSLLLASPQKTHKGKKRSDTTPLPRRLLPKRQCTKSRVDGYTSDESSIVASPILPKRTLTLQPHQVAAAGEGAFPRRERRGRPKLEDYVYVCEEVCSHCGGEWKLDGDEVEEEETKLIRSVSCLSEQTHSSHYCMHRLSHHMSSFCELGARIVVGRFIFIACCFMERMRTMKMLKRILKYYAKVQAKMKSSKNVAFSVNVTRASVSGELLLPPSKLQLLTRISQ